MNSKKSAFILLFAIAALISSQINFSPLLGVENQSFTFFQFLAPIAGGFLGIAGIAAVLLSNIASFLISGEGFTVFSLGIPSLFAVYYFYKNNSNKPTRSSLAISLIPLLCIFLFITHPTGSQVWFYSLYWLIPALALILFPGRLITRSLGSTFTAHAIGSTIFLYTIPTEPALWLTLIPIVAYERGLFTLGISASYIAANTILDSLSTKLNLTHLNISKNYAIQNLRLI